MIHGMDSWYSLTVCLRWCVTMQLLHLIFICKYTCILFPTHISLKYFKPFWHWLMWNKMKTNWQTTSAMILSHWASWLQQNLQPHAMTTSVRHQAETFCFVLSPPMALTSHYKTVKLSKAHLGAWVKQWSNHSKKTVKCNFTMSKSDTQHNSRCLVTNHVLFIKGAFFTSNEDDWSWGALCSMH